MSDSYGFLYHLNILAVCETQFQSILTSTSKLGLTQLEYIKQFYSPNTRTIIVSNPG